MHVLYRTKLSESGPHTVINDRMVSDYISDVCNKTKRTFRLKEEVSHCSVAWLKSVM